MNGNKVEVKTEINPKMFGYLSHLAEHRFDGDLDALLRFALEMWLGDIFLLGMERVEREIEERKQKRTQDNGH